ncbi:uncharacterized protein K12H4.2 [Copidosoma floridanum]|uniref:uncharacterized protein K12H4.2 n=1 Tax=Copidosoma floridanum TaxID=29053 RepID=UPI0006C975D5|nr:uncharacterized protein K12H4.2 [Copidosoma floridanum]
MCRCKSINEINYRKQTISQCRINYANKKLSDSENFEEDKSDEHNLPSAFATKYKVFRDEDAPVIFDVNEEKKRIALSELHITETDQEDPYADINLTRGTTGVYEIEDLVEILQKNNARQLFVALVPKESSYVDYIVVVTGKSFRHMLALATTIRKIFKLKMNKNDQIPRIEGENSKEWVAMDLGNIALHIFSQEARKKYDLETLWAVGPQHDDLCNQKDDEDIMDKYKSFLKDLQPAE